MPDIDPSKLKPCRECSALVVNDGAHIKWHEGLIDEIREVVRDEIKRLGPREG